MKGQNLLCCATLAFVNQRIEITGRQNSVRSRRVSQRVHLRLSNSGGGDQDYMCHGCESGGGSTKHRDDHERSRRSLFGAAASNAFLSAALLILTNVNSAGAACLSGDIRSDCIGVYKLPIDAAESSYVETPEKLRVYAPDLRWVPPVEYPPNYANALIQLKEQRKRLDDTRDLVARGDIENAGLAFLDITPKINAAGIVIMKSFGNASNDERNAAMKRKDAISSNDGNPSSTEKATNLEMKAYRIEYALNELLGSLGETDVMMGQGLRGQLGVSAPAQIQILSNIADCRKAFDNLLTIVPEKVDL